MQEEIDTSLFKVNKILGFNYAKGRVISSLNFLFVVNFMFISYKI